MARITLILTLITLIMNSCSCTKKQALPCGTSQEGTMTIERTEKVVAYYPDFSRIDLVCGTMPSQQEESVIFCAEGAFTHDLLDEFAHTNIDGDHVSGGKRYTGAQCKDNSGAFTWTPDGGWKLTVGDYSKALDEAAAGGGMGFGQALIVTDGKAVKPLWRSGYNEYRALCEKDGKLCIVDSRGSVWYGEFVDRLVGYGVTWAIYLDMGPGWNHSWWRDGNGKVTEIHPQATRSKYCTNWITFYK
ncbi:MAG: hypothetical protein MJZ74_02095 [Muribaculaceae bacterium]|nr:hypothetical protein [Muribaculaceae bacterium]